MNKLFFSSAIVFCAIASITCGTKKIVLKRSKPYTITLAETAGTGYGWQYQANKPALINVKDKGFIAAHKGLAGSSGLRQFAITGKKAGRTTITFTLRRPWEKDIAPIKKEIFTIIVK